MTAAGPYPIVLHADQEHRGLRLAIPLILFVSFWVAYFALSALLRAVFPGLNSAVVLSCVGAIPLSLVVGGVSEVLLKRTWHSGHQVTLDGDSIVVELSGEATTRMARGQRINDLWWCFRLGAYKRGGRERRVPNRWFCFAGQLEQEGERLIVFCYAPPKEASAWQEQYTFHELDPEEVYDTSFKARFGPPTRPEITPEIIAGRAGKYWLAERRRWQQGVELTPEDFGTFLQVVRREE